jgi:hypothetical protein
VVCVGKIDRRGTGGEGEQTLGIERGESQTNGAPHGLSDEVHPLQVELVQQVTEVLRKALQRPRIAGVRDAGLPHPPRIEADDSELAGEDGNPGVPQAVIFGHPVMQHRGWRGGPGIREIIDHIIKLRTIRQSDLHRTSPQ